MSNDLNESAFADAHEAGITLVPGLSGPTRLDGARLHYNATASVDDQQEAIWSALRDRDAISAAHGAG